MEVKIKLNGGIMPTKGTTMEADSGIPVSNRISHDRD